MSNKVQSLFLHQAVVIPKTKILGFTSIIPEKFPGTVMTWEKDHVELTSSGVRVRIPHANISVAIMEQDEPEKATKTK